MKLTKKDFFDGQEMTEREREIYEQGKEDASAFFWFLVGMCIGAFVITLTAINKH